MARKNSNLGEIYSKNDRNFEYLATIPPIMVNDKPHGWYKNGNYFKIEHICRIRIHPFFKRFSQFRGLIPAPDAPPVDWSRNNFCVKD